MTYSVDTGVAMRDNDLRSENFFSAEHFPTIAFRSTHIEPIDDGNWHVTGDLTIRGITRGYPEDRVRGTWAGFSGHRVDEIYRRDFVEPA